MHKEEFKFKDFNDQDRDVTLYFNLTVDEVADLHFSHPGGYQRHLDNVSKSGNIKVVLDEIKKLAHLAYGEKSEDGLYFRKSPERVEDLKASAFYDDWLFSLLENDAAKGVKFIEGILPAKLLDAAAKKLNGESTEPSASEKNDQSAATAKDRWDAREAQKVQSQPNPVEDAPRTNVAGTEQDPDFLAWKQQRAADQNGGIETADYSSHRPPHESGS